MRVIVDQAIPYIREAIEQYASEVIYLPGSAFTPESVRQADVLIIRTRTRCDKNLLSGSRVQLILTATIGFDHIDTAYCQKAGIKWVSCPGCNAGSVQQYIQSVWILCRQKGLFPIEKPVWGIVGVGHVGNRVAEWVEQMGMTCLRNDPPRQEAGESGLVSLEQIATEADIITFHTPLSFQGAHATYHLADTRFFASLHHSPLIINTSRGEVIETSALKRALQTKQIRQAVIDVWENEPHIDTELLHAVFIGTPHIAGYSADGKAQATRMVLEAFCQHFSLPPRFLIEPPALEQPITHTDPDSRALAFYDPRNDAASLLADVTQFESIRNHYPLRREDR